MARHTFAFHLKHTSDNIHVIKDALGHSDSHTTEIYLENLDDEVLG
ncbi:tyrosine-type recombinase/integrase [Paraflavitalea speifideaquila]